jgi:hypothetical protein
MNEQLEKIIFSAEEHTGPLFWTFLGLREIAKTMNKKGYKICHSAIQTQLKDMGYTLNMKSSTAKDMSEQCSYINKLAWIFNSEKDPVIYLDLNPVEIPGKDTWYRSYGNKSGAFPYSQIISDMGHEPIFQEKGLSADSFFWQMPGSYDPVSCAAGSIELWFNKFAGDFLKNQYPEIKKLYVIYSGGDRNIITQKVFYEKLESLAKKYQLPVYVSRLPPCTFRFNKIECKIAFFHYFGYNRKRALRIAAQVNMLQRRIPGDNMPFPDPKERNTIFEHPRSDAWNRVWSK